MGMTMMGQGLYDAAEVARLSGVPADRVVRWSNDSAHGPAVVTPTFPPMFAFADLVGIRVAKILHGRKVSDRDLRHGVKVLRQRTGFDRPLAHGSVIKTLATSGKSFLALEDGEYVDLGKGRHGVFQEVIELHLQRITFSGSGDPERWTPVAGVVLDPTIQAGAPCVDGTRVPTAVVAGLLDGSDPDDVAWDLDLSVEAVSIADHFEELLAQGAGLPV